MSRKAITTLVIILVLGILLIPPILRTLRFATNAQGLIVLASLCEDEVSFNPFSINGYIVRPKLAYWVLMNAEYPYKNKFILESDLHAPLVNFAGSVLDMSCLSNDKIYALIDLLIKRGESVNEYMEGFTALHSAIISNNPDYLDKLLKAGADPYLKVRWERSKSYNFNAFEILNRLMEKHPDQYRAVYEVMEKYK